MNNFECPRCGHCCQAEVNMNTEAMQMALDMLNEIADDVYCDQKLEGVITAVRQALAQPEQEPVAWISDSPTKGNGKQLHWTKSEAWRWSSNITPLYTAPSKQWVGLTDEEINSVRYSRDWTAPWTDTTFARAIETKLKEKNHG